MEINIRDLNKAELFAGLFQHMKLFTENINIMFEQNRMFIQTMDASHISIIEINIPARWFDEYILKENVSLTIGINSHHFNQGIEHARKIANNQYQVELRR
jgi:DNA polymerase III sliding clamp (beta) subunit (PCNA family)